MTMMSSNDRRPYTAWLSERRAWEVERIGMERSAAHRYPQGEDSGIPILSLLGPMHGVRIDVATYGRLKSTAALPPWLSSPRAARVSG